MVTNSGLYADAVDRYYAAGGRHVVFVGEGPGGRTGDGGFHARLGETVGCITCNYGAVDAACTCGIEPHWTRTSRMAACLAGYRHRAARVRAGPC